MKLLRSQTYRITEARGGGAQIVGQRCRLLLPSAEVDVPSDKGFISGLRAWMLSGKQAESTVDLPPCKVKPISKRVCRCSAYKFPHAPGFGQCSTSREEESPKEGIDLDDLFDSGKMV